MSVNKRKRKRKIINRWHKRGERLIVQRIKTIIGRDVFGQEMPITPHAVEQSHALLHRFSPAWYAVKRDPGATWITHGYLYSDGSYIRVIQDHESIDVHDRDLGACYLLDNEIDAIYHSLAELRLISAKV